MFALRVMKGNFEVWQWILLLSVMLPMTIKDFRIKKINGYLCIVTILAAFTVRTYVMKDSNIEVLLDLVPGMVLYLISVLTNEAIGKGDALILLFIGSVMGLKHELITLLISILLAGAISLVLCLSKKIKKDTEIPFVPFLSFGVIVGGIL